MEFSKEATRIFPHLNLQLNSFTCYAGKLPFGNPNLKAYFSNTYCRRMKTTPFKPLKLYTAEDTSIY